MPPPAALTPTPVCSAQCKDVKSLRGKAATLAAKGATVIAAPGAAAAADGQPLATPVAAPVAVPPGAKIAEPWEQCGGVLKGHSESSGRDASWTNVVCPQGHKCIRQDK